MRIKLIWTRRQVSTFALMSIRSFRFSSLFSQVVLRPDDRWSGWTYIYRHIIIITIIPMQFDHVGREGGSHCNTYVLIVNNETPRPGNAVLWGLDPAPRNPLVRPGTISIITKYVYMLYEYNTYALRESAMSGMTVEIHFPPRSVRQYFQWWHGNVNKFLTSTYPRRWFVMINGSRQKHIVIIIEIPRKRRLIKPQ